ncbi:hypothetical protein [Calidithermus chliarophilus]|uniref:hypothetical protein n=1 Tax=Calidithermus chliarophilus TaxID=52023 RepID=UPI000483602E|nr:hypothetical protein [Calidithermus chliarophilus]
MSPQTPAHEQVRAVTLALPERLLPQGRDFAVRRWDGAVLPATREPARATPVLPSSEGLGRMLHPPPDVFLGEAFLQMTCTTRSWYSPLRCWRACSLVANAACLRDIGVWDG